MKKTILLLAVIILLGVGWTVGWFFVQERVGKVLDEQIARLEQRGKVIECQNRTIEGYPFRIVIDCPDFLFNDIGSGFGFNFKSLKTAAQVYQPGKIVVEMQPVGGLKLPQQGQMAIDWQSLRASIYAKLEGVERFSLLGKQMNVVPVSNELAAAQIGEFQLHGRKVDAADVQLATRMKGVASQRALWPDFDMEAYFRFAGIYQQLLAGRMLDEIGRQAGLRGEVEEIVYSPENAGAVKVSGPFSVSQNGLVSGQFDVTATDVSALIDEFAKANPVFEDQMRNVGVMLASVAKKNDDGSMSITVLIDNGQIKFGLIPIGFLPPVY